MRQARLKLAAARDRSPLPQWQVSKFAASHVSTHDEFDALHDTLQAAPLPPWSATNNNNATASSTTNNQ
jgi:hypothetical protein